MLKPLIALPKDACDESFFGIGDESIIDICGQRSLSDGWMRTEMRTGGSPSHYKMYTARSTSHFFVLNSTAPIFSEQQHQRTDGPPEKVISQGA